MLHIGTYRIADLEPRFSKIGVGRKMSRLGLVIF